MTTAIDPEVYAWVVLPILVFCARVMDVTLGTLRIIFIARGRRKLAPLLGFFEVLIWIVVVSQIMQNLHSPLSFIAYAAGFATGNYVGMWIEDKLAIGTLVVRVIVPQEASLLMAQLAAAGYGVTSILQALRLAGQLAIVATGWGGLNSEEVPASVFVLDTVPHDWLFPQVAAVVHHGGAGTTGAGLRAGKPTVICPFVGDQTFWGNRVATLGVGPRPIPQRRLTANRLAEAIHLAVSDENIRRRAAALGAVIRSEDGVGQAVAHIVGHV